MASAAAFSKGRNVCFQRNASPLSLPSPFYHKATLVWEYGFKYCIFPQLTTHKVREEKEEEKGEGEAENASILLLGGHALGILEKPPSAISRCRDNKGIAHAPLFSAVQGFWKLTFHWNLWMHPHFQGDLKSSSFFFPNHLYVSSWSCSVHLPKQHGVAACSVIWPLGLHSNPGYPTFDILSTKVVGYTAAITGLALGS